MDEREGLLGTAGHAPQRPLPLRRRAFATIAMAIAAGGAIAVAMTFSGSFHPGQPSLSKVAPADTAVSMSLTNQQGCIVNANIDLSDYESSEENFEAVLAWRPTSATNRTWLWSPIMKVLQEKNHTFAYTLYRMRLGTQYTVSLWVNEGAGFSWIMDSDIVTATSGYTFFDTGPFAKTSGLPGYDIVSLTGAYDQEGEAFRGVFSLDDEGYIVWYYDAGAYTYVFDYADDELVMLHAHQENEFFPGELRKISKDGTTLASFKREECTAALDSWGALDHEVRWQSETEVFTVLKQISSFKDNKYSKYLHSDTYYKHFGGAHIARWNPESPEESPEILFDAFEVLSPLVNVYNDSSAYSTFTAECEDRQYTDVLDWMHGNSVSVSDYDGSLILSLHNLNTVLSISPAGEVKWRLSSVLDDFSDFKFETEDSKFYSQHDVIQLEDGRLSMFDNGITRPGCKGDDHHYKGCYSRALILDMNFETGIVKTNWTFEESSEKHIGEYGGAVRQSPSGGYYVSYCKYYQKHKSERPTKFFEVSASGDLISEMVIPSPNASWTSGSYRALTKGFVKDESSVKPF